jgi:membrane protein involved in colicin uptake
MLLDSRFYSKPFLGSVLIHIALLSFFILSFQTAIQTRSDAANTESNIVQAAVVDSAMVDSKAIEQQRQLEQTKLERLKQDMAKAKKEKDQLAVLKEENQAESERLKEAERTRAQEDKKQAALKQKEIAQKQAAVQAQKAQAAKEKALKAAAAEKAKIASDKVRVAAHQSRIASEVEQVLAQWSSKIKNNRRLMIDGMPLHLSCRVALQMLPDGSVRVQLVQSSGHPVYDDLSIKAIYKSEPFDLPDNPEVRDQVKNIELNFLNDEF